MTETPNSKEQALLQELDGLRDLSDFCNTWRRFRTTVIDEEAPRASLTPAGQCTLAWMVKLVDRACLSDEF